MLHSVHRNKTQRHCSFRRPSNGILPWRLLPEFQHLNLILVLRIYLPDSKIQKYHPSFLQEPETGMGTHLQDWCVCKPFPNTSSPTDTLQSDYTPRQQPKVRVNVILPTASFFFFFFYLHCCSQTCTALMNITSHYLNINDLHFTRWYSMSVTRCYGWCKTATKSGFQ